MKPIKIGIVEFSFENGGMDEILDDKDVYEKVSVYITIPPHYEGYLGSLKKGGDLKRFVSAINMLKIDK